MSVKLVDASVELLNGLKEEVTHDDFLKVNKAQIKEREKNLKENSYWLSNISYYLGNNDDLNTLPKWEEQINSLTADEIKKAAQKYIDTDNMIKVIMEPETKM